MDLITEHVSPVVHVEADVRKVSPGEIETEIEVLDFKALPRPSTACIDFMENLYREMALGMQPPKQKG